MTLLTNKNGGQVHAEGAALEALKRNGWKEVASEKKEATPSSTPAEPTKKAQPRTRRTTKK